MKYLYYFNIFFLFLSCNRTPYPADIEAVLDSAGKNRKQLELVLEHYSQQEKDSLKLQAAEYLIRYMPGKCTETYEARWEDITSALYRWDNVKNKERLMQELGEKKVYEDIHCITAQYLINNIELAFWVWQEQPWGKHIPFDTFCEEILPYRVGKEPLEDWRGKVLAAFDDQLAYFKEHPEISVVEACCRINRLLPTFAWVSYPMPAMNYSMLMSTPRGTCDEMGALAVFVMRALGIPVSQDFTLQWPNRIVGHSWNSVCDSTGRHISFMGTETNPGETHLGTRLAKSKVYRTMYAKQQTDGKDKANLPDELANPYMKDVSNEYANCTYCVDIPKLPAVQTDAAHTVYLLSFGKEASCIVDKGELIAGKIRFTHIGNRVTYLPVSFSDGHYTAIGYPFRIDESGILHIFSTDPTNREIAIVTDIGLDQSMLYRMQEGVFEGANQADFADKKTLYTIKDMPKADYQAIRVPDMTAYRYVRYVSPKGGNGNVAEVEFYGEEGKKLTGKNIGTSGAWYNGMTTCDKAFDGNIYTFFDAPEGKGDFAWTGLDLGKPQSICEIRYCPRIEDCRITSGRTYELYYWNNNEWEVLERKQAESDQLIFQVPANGLFYLRDTKNDVESHKFFTVKEGKQVWL